MPVLSRQQWSAIVCWFVFSDAHTSSPHKLHDVDPALILFLPLRIYPIRKLARCQMHMKSV